MAVKMKWERIGECEFRAMVFGGWIVKTLDPSVANGISTCFVPDESHEWVV